MAIPPSILSAAQQPKGSLPSFPGAMSGSPTGPGAQAPTAPGAGAGNAAAARAAIGQAMSIMVKALPAFPFNTPDFKALSEAITKLSKHFQQPEDQSLVPAAISQMAMSAKSGSPPLQSIAPPIQPVPQQGMAEAA